MRLHLSVALCAAAAFSLCTPQAAAQTSFGITVPQDVPLGGQFNICIEGQPGGVAFLFAGLELGTTPSKFGDLCLKLPAFGVFEFFMPSSGLFCFPCDLPCQPQLEGVTVHLMGIIANGGPTVATVTNCATIHVVDTGLCDTGVPGDDPGDFVSYTQGAYGAACTGNNPSCTLQATFAGVFPNGVLLGDQDGIDGDQYYSLVLTSQQAVVQFLPEGMPRNPFDMDLTDPTNSAAGVIGGQLATAKINVGLDAAGVFDAQKNYPGIKLGDLVYVSGVEPILIGKTVNEVIAIADAALARELVMPADLDNDTVTDLTFPQLNVAVELININFDNGNVSLGHLVAP